MIAIAQVRVLRPVPATALLAAKHNLSRFIGMLFCQHDSNVNWDLKCFDIIYQKCYQIIKFVLWNYVFIEFKVGLLLWKKHQSMNQGKYLFTQLTDFLPCSRVFDRILEKHDGNTKINRLGWTMVLLICFNIFVR